MSSQIIAFRTVTTQPPIPSRARPARLRTLVEFPAIVAWICSAILSHRGEHVGPVSLDSVAPALRDQVTEETVRALASMDPIAEGVARHRARKVGAELLAKVLAEATELELQDPEYLQDRGNVIADAVLERYRLQLVYGGSSTESN